VPRRSSVLDHPQHERIADLILAGDQTVKSIADQHGVKPFVLQAFARQIRSRDARGRDLDVGSPLDTFRRAFNLEPLPHQVVYLSEQRATLVLKGRQTGFTTAAAGLAVHVALSKPGSTSVVVSPSLRQSGEVTDRARAAFWSWDTKLRQDSASLLRTAAGSRIISLPGSARGIRGYSVDGLLVIDEAAFVDDATWAAAWPLVSASGGRIIVQSTPGLALGFFHELVTEPPDDWAVTTITSAEAGTVSSEFLERVRETMAPELFAQEYEATFGTAEPIVGVPLFWDGGDSMFTDEGDDHAHLHSRPDADPAA
jgi:transposase-like protein